MHDNLDVPYVAQLRAEERAKVHREGEIPDCLDDVRAIRRQHRIVNWKPLVMRSGIAVQWCCALFVAMVCRQLVHTCFVFLSLAINNQHVIKLGRSLFRSALSTKRLESLAATCMLLRLFRDLSN
uniref:Uncharacterized protein n=1 Tax=Alexandrium monilatum TaxID=311494 RepID=A0A7S4T7L3_9DINO|mmetsp:Transcript_48960/g.151809  ORF Transcript_48960/g.151809 Transcript_48960/m.151809 type:complete len:125 (+) Transcript_48960:218-592(+)